MKPALDISATYLHYGCEDLVHFRLLQMLGIEVLTHVSKSLKRRLARPRLRHVLHEHAQQLVPCAQRDLDGCYLCHHLEMRAHTVKLTSLWTSGAHTPSSWILSVGICTKVQHHMTRREMGIVHTCVELSVELRKQKRDMSDNFQDTSPVSRYSASHNNFSKVWEQRPSDRNPRDCTGLYCTDVTSRSIRSCQTTVSKDGFPVSVVMKIWTFWTRR